MVLLIASCIQDEGDQKQTIKLYDGQWNSLSVNNAIAEFIIEVGYGYSVEMIVTTN